MGAALLAVGLELLIGIVIGLIVTVIGLFLGNIIVFDSIALAILAGFLSHGLLGVHPALAVVFRQGYGVDLCGVGAGGGTGLCPSPAGTIQNCIR